MNTATLVLIIMMDFPSSSPNPFATADAYHPKDHAQTFVYIGYSSIEICNEEAAYIQNTNDEKDSIRSLYATDGLQLKDIEVAAFCL
jgi:hypothetical protein